MEWYVAYEQVGPYVIRIETMDGFGTGFLFAYNKDRSVAVIATAAHVVQMASDWRQPVKVGHGGSKKMLYLQEGDRAISLDRVRDAAGLLVRGDAFRFPKDVLPLLPEGKVKKIGVEVGWVGFPHLAPENLCFFSGAISSRLKNENAYLIDGVAINGVSGGPVFARGGDKTTELVGVVSAYIVNRQLGHTLPGLLRAQDLTALHNYIKTIKSLDEAKEKEEEEKQKQAERPKVTGPKD